jgi:hypothetical protein
MRIRDCLSPGGTAEWAPVKMIWICLTTLIAARSPLAAADPDAVHDGTLLFQAEEPLVADAPGEPANAASKTEWDEKAGTIRLRSPRASAQCMRTRKKQFLMNLLTASESNCLFAAG